MCGWSSRRRIRRCTLVQRSTSRSRTGSHRVGVVREGAATSTTMLRPVPRSQYGSPSIALLEHRRTLSPRSVSRRSAPQRGARTSCPVDVGLDASPSHRPRSGRQTYTVRHGPTRHAQCRSAYALARNVVPAVRDHPDCRCRDQNDESKHRRVPSCPRRWLPPASSHAYRFVRDRQIQGLQDRPMTSRPPRRRADREGEPGGRRRAR